MTIHTDTLSVVSILKVLFLYIQISTLAVVHKVEVRKTGEHFLLFDKNVHSRSL